MECLFVALTIIFAVLGLSFWCFVYYKHLDKEFEKTMNKIVDNYDSYVIDDKTVQKLKKRSNFCDYFYEYMNHKFPYKAAPYRKFKETVSSMFKKNTDAAFLASKGRLTLCSTTRHPKGLENKTPFGKLLEDYTIPCIVATLSNGRERVFPFDGFGEVENRVLQAGFTFVRKGDNDKSFVYFKN